MAHKLDAGFYQSGEYFIARTRYNDWAVYKGKDYYTSTYEIRLRTKAECLQYIENESQQYIIGHTKAVRMSLEDLKTIQSIYNKYHQYPKILKLSHSMKI